MRGMEFFELARFLVVLIGYVQKIRFSGYYTLFIGYILTEYIARIESIQVIDLVENGFKRFVIS